MIYVIGTDIINLERSWKSNFKKLCEKVLTENENKLLDDLPQKMQTSFFAKQWAMKESISKAFGTGFRDVVIPSNMEILRNERGRPVLYPLGPLRDLMENEQISACHLSVSDVEKHVIAVATLESSAKSST